VSHNAARPAVASRTAFPEVLFGYFCIAMPSNHFKTKMEKKMNTRLLKQTAVLALAMMVTLSIGSSVLFGQDKPEGNTLTGTWQSVVTPRDCQTGTPAPFSFKALTTFNQGGTMSEDALDVTSPYRTGGHGIWQRTSGHQYTVAWMFYTFAPNGAFSGSVKVTVNKTLGPDFNSLTGDGAVQVYDLNGNLVFTGCSDETATRFAF
jgi:hypothetical protein